MNTIQANIHTADEHIIGQFVLYRNTGSSGICRITDIRDEDFGTGRRLYYVLGSVNERGEGSSVFYVPYGSEAASKLKTVLSAEQINAVIDESRESECDWIGDTKTRAAEFERIISGGDRTAILRMIKLLYLRKKELEKQKKRLYTSDARILASAEKIIIEEFSFALGIEKSEVIEYIASRLENGERERKEAI